MALYCSVSSSNPSTTNVVMGYINSNSYYFEIDKASDADKKIVIDFISVIGKHFSVIINNFTDDNLYEINIVIPEDADTEEKSLDYSTLTAAKKNKVNAFIGLITSLIN
jgi:hypothetical protein